MGEYMPQLVVPVIIAKLRHNTQNVILSSEEDKLCAYLHKRYTSYRTALSNEYITPSGQHVQKFVNLDMEEYRDLHLDETVQAQASWTAASVAERKQLLVCCAEALAHDRGELIGAMLCVMLAKLRPRQMLKSLKP